MNQMSKNPVALITGGARRIGASIVQRLHSNGYNIVLHYRLSEEEATTLTEQLNYQRANSAIAVSADLNKLEDVNRLAEVATGQWQRLDVLVNNASSFYPTPLGGITSDEWDDLLNSNLKAPFFLAQAVTPMLKKNSGSIINIADIYADRPLKKHPVYCIAKAGNVMLTKSLARELAPEVRVNGIAPGAILWSEQDGAQTEAERQAILDRIPLERNGKADDIANTVIFLVKNSPYITGQIITVDGGRSLCS